MYSGTSLNQTLDESVLNTEVSLIQRLFSTQMWHLEQLDEKCPVYIEVSSNQRSLYRDSTVYDNIIHLRMYISIQCIYHVIMVGVTLRVLMYRYICGECVVVKMCCYQ